VPEFLDCERDDKVFPELFHCHFCGTYVTPRALPPYDDEHWEELVDYVPICRECKKSGKV
jgi:hypothetical protein